LKKSAEKVQPSYNVNKKKDEVERKKFKARGRIQSSEVVDRTCFSVAARYCYIIYHLASSL